MKFAARILLLAGLAGAAFGQGIPIPIGKPQFFTSNGVPLSGGHVCSYNSGTSTPVATFTDYTLTVPNPLCVVLDSAGRGNIWLDPAKVYRIILKDAANVTIWTADGVTGAAGGSISGATWTLNGSTVSNAVGTKVCIGAAACTTALAQLNVTGTSSGSNYLIRIDDAGNAPGINLYGGGNSLGAIGADAAGVRLRDGSGNSQMLVAAGAVTVQNAGAGSSTLTVKGGSAQGSALMLDLQSNAGTSVASINPLGQYIGSLYNAAPVAGTNIAFQTSNSNFSVNGNGDISSNGSINATGADGLDPYKVNGTTIVDKDGNATFTTLTCTGSPCGTGGGGGSGTPGGSNTFVQFNLSGAFGGSSNLTWNNTSKLLTVHAVDAVSAAIAVGTGFIQSIAGFVSPTATAYNTIQSPLGGVAARSLTATKYIQAGNSAGAPTVSTSDTFNAGAMYWDTGSVAMQVYNGSGWVSLGGGSGSPGGSDTNVQYNSSGSFGGSGNFTWDNSGRLLTVSATNSSSAGIAVANGYIQAAAGFLAPIGSATAYNSIQAPGGGMAAKSFTASKYIQTGSGSADPAVTTSDTFNPGALYWNTVSAAMKVYNGSAWVNLGSSSGGTPGGINTNVQFNNSGALGGSSNFSWNESLQLLSVTSPNSSSAGIAVANGFIQAANGFFAPAASATRYNVFQAPAGGMAARSFTATDYIQVGSVFGNPSPTSSDSFHAGALSFNSALGQLQVFNGSGWVNVAGGSSGGVTSLSGTFNQVNVSGSTGAITLSLPQPIAQTSTPTFAGVISNGAFNSLASGGAIAFQTANTRLQINGNGDISGLGELNMSGAYKMAGSTVINTARQFVGSGVVVSGGIETAGVNITGGLLGQNWNLNFPTPFTINGGGAFTSLIIRGGVVVSAFGILGNGRALAFFWLAGLLHLFVARRRRSICCLTKKQ